MLKYYKFRNIERNFIVAKGLEFDPGFGPYLYAFHGSVEYLYMEINRFKNFSQRKMKFRQYYPKLLELFNNNLGFYVGCLMWGAYVNNQEEQELLNNHCLNQEYDEKGNTAEVDFMIKFLELLPKDVKYFLGETYTINDDDMKIMNLYKEFLTINKGFVNSKTTKDILVPKDLKSDNLAEFKTKIDEVIATKNLANFLKYKNLILE